MSPKDFREQSPAVAALEKKLTAKAFSVDEGKPHFRIGVFPKQPLYELHPPFTPQLPEANNRHG